MNTREKSIRHKGTWYLVEESFPHGPSSPNINIWKLKKQRWVWICLTNQDFERVVNIIRREGWDGGGWES